MADNQFSVNVVNPLQALMLGQQSYKTQQDANKEQALTDARGKAVQAYQGGDAKGALATLLGVGDTQGASALGNVIQQDWTRQHTTQQDALANQHWGSDFGLRKRAADRADDVTPTGFQKGPGGTYEPLPGGPQDPKYIEDVATRKAKADLAAGGGKPIPYETLGGTKFLIPQPGGGYANVDPRAMGSQVPSSAKVVGDAEGVASGLYDQPAAPGQRPPMQGDQPQGQPQGQPTLDLNAVDPNTGRREGWLQSQPPEVQAYIKKVADYEVDPRTSSIKGGKREQLMSAVANYDPTYDQNNFGSRAKAIKDFATGPQGNSVRSFDVAIDHLDTLQRYAKAMNSGDSRLINTIRNQWREATGSELPTDVRAVAPIVGAEVSKAIIGSNNALADREELRRPLALSSSPEQLSGAIGAYKDLMAGQLKGLKKQYEDTTGKKNFNDRVREGTRNALLGKSDSSGSDSSNVTSSGIKWSVQ